MFCGNCGAEVEDGADFCGNCGARMGSAQTGAGSTPVSGYRSWQTSQQPSGTSALTTPRLCALLASAVLVLVAARLLVCLVLGMGDAMSSLSAFGAVRAAAGMALYYACCLVLVLLAVLAATMGSGALPQGVAPRRARLVGAIVLAVILTALLAAIAFFQDQIAPLLGFFSVPGRVLRLLLACLEEAAPLCAAGSGIGLALLVLACVLLSRRSTSSTQGSAA